MTYERDPTIHIHIKHYGKYYYNAMTIADRKYCITILYHLDFPDTAKHYQ